jgi:peptidoglycan-associated lipoprotein
MDNHRWAIKLLCVALMFGLSGCCWFKGCRKNNPVTDFAPVTSEDIAPPQFEPYTPDDQSDIMGGPVAPGNGVDPLVSWNGGEGKVRPPAAGNGTNLERVHFDYDQYDIRADQIKVLEANVQYLKDHANEMVTVEGHTDERGTGQYNMALGESRANTIRDYMIRAGISPGRISTVSYGKERPLENQASEWGWSQNRRGEFVVYDSGQVAMSSGN